MFPYISLILSTYFAAQLKKSNPFRYIIFFVPTVYFVAFRYEVGFDWTTYKSNFETFQQVGFATVIENIFIYSVLLAQEPLFLLLSAAFANIFASYEVLQATLYLFFVYSVFRLGSALGTRNVIAAFVPIHLFLLFSLEFSTVRQAVAISTFNVGLAFFIKKRKVSGTLIMMVSPLLQGSAMIYILALISASAAGRNVKAGALICLGLLVLMYAVGLDSIPLEILPGFLAEKFRYYVQERSYNSHIIEITMFMLLFAWLAYLTYNRHESFSDHHKAASQMLFYLCVIAFVGFSVPTIRNRVLYEVVILASLLSFTPKFVPSESIKRLTHVVGIASFSWALLLQPNYVFSPYQNYLWFSVNGYQSTGQERQQRLRYALGR